MDVAKWDECFDGYGFGEVTNGVEHFATQARLRVLTGGKKTPDSLACLVEKKRCNKKQNRVNK